MPNLLESLLDNAVDREDDQRLTVTKRPFPIRGRDIFDLFSAMGAAASLDGLIRGIEFRFVDPRVAVFAVLGRYPTAEELRKLPSPYKPVMHLRRLVLSREFRRIVAARVFAAFPEKKRLLFVRLPRCATQITLDTITEHHPLLPIGLDDAYFRDPEYFTKLIGKFAGRFETTRTLAVTLPTMAPFTMSNADRRAAGNAPLDDLLNWDGSEPACRPQDLLFAIMRKPLEAALSQVNGRLAALRNDPAGGELPESLRDKVGPLPARDDTNGWRKLGRALLPETVARNPICTALGDGTLDAAIDACGASPVQLVGLARYAEWARVALGPRDEPLQLSAPKILRHEDLTPQDRDILEDRVAQDVPFYASFEKKFSSSSLPALPGHALM